MEEGNVGEALLKKQHYYENCPGCKVDKAKDLKTDVSFRNLLNIWMVVLCSELRVKIELNPTFNSRMASEPLHSARPPAIRFLIRSSCAGCEGVRIVSYMFKPTHIRSLPISSLFPYLYFMIRDFNIAKREEDISAYAGYVGSAFMLGRSFTSIPWGMVADRYGRKPVAIIGIFSVIIFNTLFGLSTSFWMAVTTRFFLGSLNGLLGPMKAYCSEIFREEKQALGLSTFSAAWGMGLIIGPALGGYLAQPTVKYPHIFPKDSFWDKFPYFLAFHFHISFCGHGFALIIYQLSLYPSLERIFGPVRFARISGVLSIPLLQSYPFIAMLSGITLFLVINIASLLKNLLSITVVTGLFLLQNRAVEQHQRGAANGIAMTGMSIFKTIGPAGGGAVLAWSQKRMHASFLPGTHMVFFILNIAEGLAVLLMFTPFLTEKKKTPSQQSH
ncbi:hypothetical protein TSUD_117440 [Trifolium subterraneum]|nr:hypothetical protein TSUD_117440 [Trifolium subterraneum]